MCPLERAKIDSLWASISNRSSRSVTVHGSTSNASPSITSTPPPVVVTARRVAWRKRAKGESPRAVLTARFQPYGACREPLDDAGFAAFALDAHVPRPAVVAGQDRIAQEIVELGVQRRAVGDAEVRAELQPSLAHR